MGFLYVNYVPVLVLLPKPVLLPVPVLVPKLVLLLNSVSVPIPVTAGTGINTDTKIPVKILAIENTDTKIPVSQWHLIPIPVLEEESENVCGEMFVHEAL
jgi:hypothetical protein